MKTILLSFVATVILSAAPIFDVSAQRCTRVATAGFFVPDGTSSTSDTRIEFSVVFDLDYSGMSCEELGYTYLAAIQFETTTTARTYEGEPAAGTEFRGIAFQLFRPLTDLSGACPAPDGTVVTKIVTAAEGIPVNRLITTGQGQCIKYFQNARVLLFRLCDTTLSSCTER